MVVQSVPLCVEPLLGLMTRSYVFRHLQCLCLCVSSDKRAVLSFVNVLVVDCHIYIYIYTPFFPTYILHALYKAYFDMYVHKGKGKSHKRDHKWI
jgi:hypothetical protein